MKRTEFRNKLIRTIGLAQILTFSVRQRSRDADLLERARVLALEIEALLACEEPTTPTVIPRQIEPLPPPDLFDRKADKQPVISRKFWAHLAKLDQKRLQKDAKKRSPKPTNEEPQS